MAGDALIDDLGDRAAMEREDRRAARHCLDQRQAERLGPIDREQQGPGLAEKFRLGVLVDLADELHPGLAEQRGDGVAEIDFVDLIDLGGDLERDAAGAGDGDSAIGALLRTDAAEKGEIAAARLEGRSMQQLRQAVRDRREEIGVRHRTSLGVRDRDQRHLAKPPVERPQVGQVLTSMKGRQGAIGHGAKHREMKQVEVEMQHVEIRDVLAHLVEQQHMVRNRVDHQRIEPQRGTRARHELR